MIRRLIKMLLPYKKIIKKFIPRKVRMKLAHQVNCARVDSISSDRLPYHSYPWGVNMFGSMSGASGLAEASRGVELGLQKAGIPMASYDFYKNDGSVELPYAINIIHANPNQLPELFMQLPDDQWKHHYNIGFWIWELETLPKDWLYALKMFDEIWVSSEFVAEAVRKETAAPVTVIPYILKSEYDEAVNRKFFNLPEDMFLALVAFDCDSVPERKNHRGAIKAFKKAFTNDDNAGLVLKVRNMTSKVQNEIKDDLEGWNNVFLIEGDFPKKSVNSLIKSVDVYMSLHRAEGFGLVSAESMLMGTPVIATNWSSNTEFMNSDVACMVDAKIIPMDKDYPPYTRGSYWAEPDIDQASKYLRNLYDDSVYRSELAKKAMVYIQEKLSYEDVTNRIDKRLEEIKVIIDNKKLAL